MPSSIQHNINVAYANSLPLHHNFTIDLVDEVKQWATFASDVVPHPANETLTAWWIGINDTGDSFRNSTVSSDHPHVEAFILSLPMFFFVGVGPPCYRFLGFVVQITDWTAFWREEMTSYFNAVVRVYLLPV